MLDPTITPEVLAGAAGILISLFLSYTPKLNVKWQALEGDTKRLIFLGALVLVSFAVAGLSCAGIVSWLSCDQFGIWLLVKAFVAAMITSQALYPITTGKAKVKQEAAASKANG